MTKSTALCLDLLQTLRPLPSWSTTSWMFTGTDDKNQHTVVIPLPGMLMLPPAAQQVSSGHDNRSVAVHSGLAQVSASESLGTGHIGIIKKPPC